MVAGRPMMALILETTAGQLRSDEDGDGIA